LAIKLEYVQHLLRSVEPIVLLCYNISAGSSDYDGSKCYDL